MDTFNEDADLSDVSRDTDGKGLYLVINQM